MAHLGAFHSFLGPERTANCGCSSIPIAQKNDRASASRRIAPILAIVCCVLYASQSLQGQGFVYNNFDSTSGLKLNGSAQAVSSNDVNVLRMTPASQSQVGSAWYCGSDCSSGSEKVFLSQGFSTTFQFQFSGGSTPPADGIAFVIQNGCFNNANSSCAISALDPTAGGTLGYGGSPTDPTHFPGLTNSVAIEFDTFCNGSDESDICSANDVSTANEVGIQSCGTAANTANHGSCSFGSVDLANLFFVDGATASTTSGSQTVTLSGANYTAAQMRSMVGLSLVLTAPEGSCVGSNGCNFGLISAVNSDAQALTLVFPATSTLSATYAIEPVLADGNVHSATVTYTPPATNCIELCPNNMTVTLDNNVVLSASIDIVNYALGGTDGALVGFTASTGFFSDNHDLLSWGFTSSGTQTGSPMNPNNPANLSQQFVFNNAVGQHVEFDFDYTTAFNNNDLTVVNNTVPTVTNDGISQSTYTSMVAGTSLAMTSCYIAPGEGIDSGGNPLCPRLTLACTNANSSLLAGDNCPQSTSRDLYWSHVLDTPNAITIPTGTAPVLAMGSDTWSPGNCILVGPEAGTLCPKSTLTQFALLSLDPIPKPGGTGGTSNSAYVAGCCEPEWNTTPTIPVWSNNTTVPVSFKTLPPSPASPTNNWVAGPNKSITWGEENLGATPDTTFPVPGDQTVTNPTACPGTWPSPGTVPPSFTATGTVSVPGPGAYEVHFFSTACHNQEELVFPSTINTGSTRNVATFKTAPFNVDTTNPAVNSVTLNPPGGFYAQNSSPTALVTCTDPSSPTIPGFFSGIAKCGAQGSPQSFGGNQQTVTTTPIVLSTTTIGTQTFTASATDVAGNSSPPSSVAYQVVGSADLAIAMIGNVVVKTGKNITYFIGVANSGPNTADLITVTDNLPLGTTFVSSGYAIESCNFLGGKPICSITPTTNSCGSVAGSCNIPALPVWTFKNPIGALVQLTVNVNAKPNTTINDTATVGEANSDPNSKNNTAQWATFVTK